MASIRQALYDYLKAQQPIIDLVNDRIFPGRAPNSARTPYITFIRISQRAEQHMLAAAKFTRASVEFNCWADEDDEAEDVADALREELDGFFGLMGTVDVRRAIVDDHFDRFEPQADGSEKPAFMVKLDLDIWFFNNVPTF